MDPKKNGKDDSDGTWTSFYEELLAEQEFSQTGRGPRWLGLLVTVVLCVIVWSAIVLLIRACLC